MAAQEVNKPPSLPPYPQMILRAIEALNEENGSNKSSISKYIESTYGQLPPGHSVLLSHHLNSMRQSGQLVFMKNNYTKYDPSAPPRRGRGRPPKPKPKPEPTGPLPPHAASGPPKPRGRPPKDPNAPPKPPNMKVSAGSGRPRGRPRKMARPAGRVVAAAEGTASGRPRGRPPKAMGPLTEVSVGQ